MDSESQLKASAAGVYGEAKRDPVCGMEVDQAKTNALKRTSEYRGTTYYFCSDSCKRRFDASPEKFESSKPAPPEAPAKLHQAGSKVVTTDPICGMPVNEAEARAAHRVSEHGGKTFLFCSDGCKRDFDKNPAKYAEKGPATPATMKGTQGSGRD